MPDVVAALAGAVGVALLGVQAAVVVDVHEIEGGPSPGAPPVSVLLSLRAFQELGSQFNRKSFGLRFSLKSHLSFGLRFLTLIKSTTMCCLDMSKNQNGISSGF